MIILLIIFLIFFCWLIYVVMKTREFLADDPSKIGKTSMIVNYGVCTIICIYCTSFIDPNATIELSKFNANPFGTIVVYCFMWLFLGTLSGASFAVISGNISMLFSIKRVGLRAFDRNYDAPGVEVASWSALYAGITATAYSLMLYTLGLSDKIFPIMLLG